MDLKRCYKNDMYGKFVCDVQVWAFKRICKENTLGINPKIPKKKSQNFMT